MVSVPTTRPVMRLWWQLVACGQVGITGDRGQGGRGRIGRSQDGIDPDNWTLRSRIHARALRLARAGQDPEDDLGLPTWMERGESHPGALSQIRRALADEPRRKSPRMLTTYEFKISRLARVAPAAPRLGLPQSSSDRSPDLPTSGPCRQPRRLSPLRQAPCWQPDCQACWCPPAYSHRCCLLG